MMLLLCTRETQGWVALSGHAGSKSQRRAHVDDRTGLISPSEVPNGYREHQHREQEQHQRQAPQRPSRQPREAGSALRQREGGKYLLAPRLHPSAPLGNPLGAQREASQEQRGQGGGEGRQ